MKQFHPDELALLAAIHADPEEYTPRLVLADWYQENEQPELAEFIRLQLVLHAPNSKPPRGSKAREKKLLQQYKATWRGAGMNGHARFPSGAKFEFFFRGLPLVTLIVDLEPQKTLDNAFALREPNHQFDLIVDLKPDGPEDIRPLLCHPLFGIAYRLEIRETIGREANGAPVYGPLSSPYIQQVTECLGNRPYSMLFLRNVSTRDWDNAQKFKSTAKACVYCGEEPVGPA